MSSFPSHYYTHFIMHSEYKIITVRGNRNTVMRGWHIFAIPHSISKLTILLTNHIGLSLGNILVPLQHECKNTDMLYLNFHLSVYLLMSSSIYIKLGAKAETNSLVLNNQTEFQWSEGLHKTWMNACNIVGP